MQSNVCSLAVLADERPSERRPTGPDVGKPQAPEKTNYLLKADYRTTSVQKLLQLSDDEARAFFERIRWARLGEGRQVCPQCGSIDSHYWCKGPRRWKCRNKVCGHQFTVLQGTRLHGAKKTYQELLALLFEFVEGKDSVSSRQLSGKYDLAYHTAYVLGMKVREAIADSMKAEPKLTGYIQADAAYFMKYVRPGNVGTGAALAAKRDQKNAGLDSEGKTKNTVSPRMHALVVFVQTGPVGTRRYKVAVVKTENQVDLLTLGKEYCDREGLLTTDGHSGYNFYTGAFQQHYVVDHTTQFFTDEGMHTNLAEGFFSRMRSAQNGAWHKMTLAHIEEYGWEFAWRQTMVGRSNLEQLEDLLARMLNSGRSGRYADYWKKSAAAPSRVPDAEDDAVAMEVDKQSVPKKRGRPSADTVRPQVPERPKRKYTRKTSLTKGAGQMPQPPGDAQESPQSDRPQESPPGR
ncbi:IS1595 family transposase [Azohydromonas sediminis]|uniref:IS1595 family transposase n=1 Tax=Azohydromonas sediminis TaxID=2259674 RepID=UPI000E650803|nr:IS1595 family transposase [Azohydromonas sediminis]